MNPVNLPTAAELRSITIKIKPGIDGLIIILLDWLGYVVVKHLSDASPDYGYYVWPLYIAANIAAVICITQKYFKNINFFGYNS